MNNRYRTSNIQHPTSNRDVQSGDRRGGPPFFSRFVLQRSLFDFRRLFSACAVLLLCLTAAAPPARADDAPFNPQPAEGDLILPLPGGGGMAFRPVLIDGGADLFAFREFTIGDRAGGFKEYPTRVVIGGAFPVDAAGGQRDWAYYLGKYEVTEAQYLAIMEPGSTNRSDLPVVNISWFDAQTFLQRYNQWLRQNAAAQLPASDGTPGFVRLPTEAEWEFAARGGAAVNPGTFDRRHPYKLALSRHEWFSGPTSSHDKLKKAGLLKPNPLGLHDLLGNVSEMTESLYRVEYYQGRTGGFTARGGTFRTPERSLRASFRNEQPFYFTDGRAVAQDEMGLRLVISAPLYTSREAIKRMETGWEEYRKTRPTPTTAAGSISPTSQQTTFQLDDALKALGRLETELAALSGVSPDAMNQLGLLKASFGNVESLILKAELDSAAAWAKMGSYTAWFLSRELKKVAASLRVIELTKQAGGSQAELDVYNGRHAKLLENIEGASAQYGLIIAELGKLSPPTVRKGFEQYEQHLIRLGAAEQLKVNGLVLKHFEQYAQAHRLDMETWMKELEE